MSKIHLAAATFSLLLGGCVFGPSLPAEATGSGGANGLGGSPAGSGGLTGAGGSIFGTGNSSGTGSGGDVGITGSAGGCGQMNVAVMPIPPDILIVQDKSGSMGNNDADKSCTGGCGTSAKWAQVSSALTTVVTSTDQSINWGLKFFSDDGSCGASADPVVTVGAGKGSAVSAAIANTSPAGSTPTRDAITTGAAYLATLNDTNPKYLLLATDGLPNCPVGCAGMTGMLPKSCTNTDNPSEDMAAEDAVSAAAAQGFKTFVIGIGTVTAAEATLNQLAVNGGVPQTGAATSYYAATDPTALENALNAIIGQVASCTISLANAPSGFTNVAISADSASGTIEIPQDPTNGWSYGPNMQSVNLNGTSCANLKNGTYSNFQFYYACAGTTIHIGAVLPGSGRLR
jgi:von Willebrand factor type A domain